jgi:glucose 1-dehydrogenase
MAETISGLDRGVFSGKTALVTGSTRGIGRTIAEWFAKAGADVIVSGRDQADVKQTIAELSEFGTQVIGFPADLSEVSDIHKLAEATLGAVEHLDILVNNAGMSIRGHFWEVTDAEWEYQTNVNYRAPFILAQSAAKHMIDNEIKGRIVNISTIGAHLCHTNGLVYDAAKGAVETMTRNMAYELAPYGITVNCVVPGAIPYRPGAEREPAWAEHVSPHIPMGQAGSADDIAKAVTFFCLPSSHWISGQWLMVDGAHSPYLHE